MKIVRRIYFYTLALIGLEVVVWGVIGLARTTLDRSLVGMSASPLASGLALVLVGLPVFLVHWLAVQRMARRDPDERASLLRATFLYASVLATLIPAAQNTLAILNRLAINVLGGTLNNAFVGAGQNMTDNLVAITINVLAAAYFLNILRLDPQADLPDSPSADARRVYRLAWLLYSLGLVAWGAYRLLDTLLRMLTGSLLGSQTQLANGLAALLVGAPIWAVTTRIIQASLDEPRERESPLRLGVLFALNLASLVSLIAAAGYVLAGVLRAALGEVQGLDGLIERVAGPLAVGLVALAVWRFYLPQWHAALRAVRDEDRRSSVQHVYAYILSALGLAGTVAGLTMLMSTLARLLVSAAPLFTGWRVPLANAMATLAVSLPVWLWAWIPLAREAAPADATARRALPRKVYLYVVIFAGVIGVMVSAGELIYNLLNGLLGNNTQDFAFNALNPALRLLVFAAFLAYHIGLLRADGRAAGDRSAERRAAYPVLVIDPGDGAFAQQVAEQARKLAPDLPVAIHVLAQGAPGEELLAARLVALPADLTAQPPEALRIWLEQYTGEYLVYPGSARRGWWWVGRLARSDAELAGQVAQAMRQAADGQPVRVSAPLSTWNIVAYVAAGLFALELLLVIFVLAMTISGVN